MPSQPQPADLSDLNQMLTGARPTSNPVQVHKDGTASFELHRMEVGQGITTQTAMLTAEELDIPVDKVRTHADAGRS